MSELISQKKLNLVNVATANGIPQNGTVYTEPFDFKRCTGFAGLLFTRSAGSVTLTQQCAFNENGPWYDPIDKNKTAIGAVITSASADSYVIFDPVLAPYARLKCVEGNVASSSVTFNLFFTEYPY